MRTLVLLVSLLGFACQLSPVITVPEEPTGGHHYDDCRQAARAYCRDVLEVSHAEMKHCVAKSTYECLSGGTR
jgi:hypothetical protein